jgi:hypothetical protein
VIIIYFDPSKSIEKRYGFHVYRPGWIYDKEQSKCDFPTREAAFEEARDLAKKSGPFLGHEIVGGVELLRPGRFSNAGDYSESDL